MKNVEYVGPMIEHMGSLLRALVTHASDSVEVRLHTDSTGRWSCMYYVEGKMHNYLQHTLEGAVLEGMEGLTALANERTAKLIAATNSKAKTQ